jgi:hypothetical protein
MAEVYQQARGELPFIIVSPCTFSNTNEITGPMLDKYRRFYPDELIRRTGDLGDNLDWDEAGLLAIVQDLRTHYDAEARIYITGFSGGGLITYRLIFQRPMLLAGAAPVCANFFHSEYRSFKGRFSDADLNFPIHLVQGEEDPNRASTWAPFLFSTPWQESGLVLAVGLPAGWLVWRKTRRVKWTAAVVLSTLLALGLFRVGRRTGLDHQADVAVGLLRDLGYPNVKRTLIPGQEHEASPEAVIESFRPYWLKEKKRGEPMD